MRPRRGRTLATPKGDRRMPVRAAPTSATTARMVCSDVAMALLPRTACSSAWRSAASIWVLKCCTWLPMRWPVSPDALDRRRTSLATTAKPRPDSPALAATLVGWIVMVALAVAATGPALFWVAAVLAGLCMGSSQSAGRALAGALAPVAQRAEFFGLWTFATRLAAIVGPLTYGAVTWATAGNHRLAIGCTGVFFVIGLWLLMRVDVARGETAAQTADRLRAAPGAGGRGG